MMKKINIIAVIVTILVMAGCQGTPETENIVTEESSITISEAQFAEAKMELARPDTVVFSRDLKAVGMVEATPAGVAVISSLVPGVISRIAVSSGTRVSKGQVLCTIISTEVVQMQQDYAETAAQMHSVQAEYERQKALSGEGIAAQKTFMQAESAYMSLKARMNALKVKLGMLGLDAERVAAGDISAQFSLKAPISGFVTQLEATSGSQANPQQFLMEIVNPDELQLQLSIFEKDLQGIKPGLKITFSSPADTSIIYQATLTTIGNALDQQTKAVTAIATINPSDRNKLIYGMYVEAAIAADAHRVYALPETAVLGADTESVVLILDRKEGGNYHFIKQTVKTGEQMHGYIQLLDGANLKDKEVLVKGGFNLVME